MFRLGVNIFRSLVPIVTTTPAGRSSCWRHFCTTITLLGAGATTATASFVSCTASSAPSSFDSKTAKMMTSSSTSANVDSMNLGYVDAASAAALDEDLMKTPGFTLEQLMELAGLSVAEAAYHMLQKDEHNIRDDDHSCGSLILIVCGPGNNGGDGLVAARHLYHFGYQPIVVYPKRSSKQPHYANLLQQCDDLGIPIWEKMPTDWSSIALVIDAIFGFSFEGEPREPFQSILKNIQDMQTKRGIKVLAVDVPSGWNVNQGDVAKSGFRPDAVISLTAPKECMRTYTGRHFVGGRFLPPGLAEKYKIRVPPYPGIVQVLQLSSGSGGDGDVPP